MAKRTAVIDIGSNSARMVIYEKTSRFAFHLIHEAKSRVRISENAYEHDGYLQKEPLERAYQALKEFSLIIAQYNVKKTLCIATSALRDAPNQKEFTSFIKKELNIPIKVISGEREAYLGGMAAANLLHLDNALSIDIGGGSTELAVYENKKVIQTYTLNLGTVRLKELYFDNNNVSGAKEYIKNEFKKLPPDFKYEDIVGIGGSLRTISKMIMQREKVHFQKLHGFTFKVSAQREYFDDILEADEKTLKELGVKKDRLDVIQPGLLILDLLIAHVTAVRITTSGVGVREGLFLSDLLRSNNDKFPSNYNPSVKSLLDRFSEDKQSDVYAQSSKLFDLLASHLQLKEKYKNSFLHAVRLSQIGKQIDFYEAHRHAYYLLLNGLTYGFSHKESVLIASLVRYQRKKLPSDDHIEKYKEYLPSCETCTSLAFLIRLCMDLFNDFDHKKNLSISLNEGCLHIRVKEIYLLQEKLKDIQNNELLNINISQ